MDANKSDMLRKVFLGLIIGFLLPVLALAQQFISPIYTDPQIFLVETKWVYFQTKHVESNTVIHQDDASNTYFIYFKIDYTFEQYINGKLKKGSWSVYNKTLHFPFRNINQFTIAIMDNNFLILQYAQENGRGTYQYIFKWVDSKNAPFAKPSYELPEVTILEKQHKKRWWMPWAKENKPPNEYLGNGIFINIELIGGGYYGGADAVSKDFIKIENDGRLIHEFQSVQNGLIIKKRKINRRELEEFANYLIEQRFFDYKLIYDCETELCVKRKFLKPTPVPLRLSLTYGDRRKVVTIPIWGKDERNIQYLNYPPTIDKIVDAIQRMASKL